MVERDFELPENKKLFFASDFHLGVPDHQTSLNREKKIIRWLDSIKPEAHTVFLLGDIFDFWFEYKRVVPKGFVRLQGKLAELTDEGIQVAAFRGNHDMWMFDYFRKEINMEVFSGTLNFTVNGKKFHIGHGDGLGPGDRTYKALKLVFSNKVCQWLFGLLPPFIGIGIAQSWSQSSRANNNNKDTADNLENERLLRYCKEKEKEEHFDYYVFGHRHKVMDVPVGPESAYINLGDWINSSSFGEFDGRSFVLKEFV